MKIFFSINNSILLEKASYKVIIFFHIESTCMNDMNKALGTWDVCLARVKRQGGSGSKPGDVTVGNDTKIVPVHFTVLLLSVILYRVCDRCFKVPLDTNRDG